MIAMLHCELTEIRRINAELQQRLDEALAREAATAEVLQVINSSPGDLAPVFDAMLDKAANLCAAETGVLFTYEHEHFQVAAWHGTLTPLRDFLIREPLRPSPNTGLGSMVRERRLIHITDISLRDSYKQRDPLTVASVELGGIRTFMAVPLLKEGSLLGAFTLYRQRVEPFTDRQIELVRAFADQAVIAIENARLITETREALEQQTATAEVLQVINSSPGDLAPVFDAMLEKALRLCEAGFGTLLTWDGEYFNRVASRGLSRELVLPMGQRRKPTPASVAERFVHGENIISIPDLIEDDAYRNSPALQAIARVGMRSYVSVALRTEAQLFGYIAIFRQEVRPFTGKQITLLQNFAAQAVIAIENARLITETREALEQQTATAEVLEVINSSPGDLGPVFDAMLEKATRLSEAAFGIMQVYDGERFRTVATRNMPPALAEFLLHTPRQPTPHSAVSRILDGEDFVHFEDMTSEQAYLSGDPRQQAFVELGGTRTYVAVALRKDDRLLGTIATYRQEIRPFSDKQIALLQNFAAQAVIAMENARLITETREALEQQTATAEVLQVINASPGDLGPVFDAMLDKAMRLCGAAFGFMTVIDGERSRTVAARGVPAAYAAFRERNPTHANAPIASRVRKGEPFIHTVDLKAERFYGEGDPQRRAIVDLGGGRTLLAVPLMRDQAVLGAIQVYRTEVHPFSAKQIALLQNFAAQAVIAMENARLLGELRQRTGDLQEALEYQTATSDVLKVISRSTFDLQPVLDTLVETAARLCSADLSLISSREEDGLRVTATFSATPEYEAFIRDRLLPLTRGSLAGRAFVERKAVQITDLTADPEFTVTETVTLGQMRTALGVPLLRESEVIGTISLARQRVEPFTERQLELVAIFADQAVIAIENTRLITETREALEQQTATAEVLQVINSSPGDLAPVFDAMLEKATRLCDAPSGMFWTFDGEFSRAVAMRGIPESYAEYLREPVQLDPATGLGRVRLGETVAVTIDLAAEEAYRAGNPQRRAFVDLGKARSAVRVPLTKDSRLLGIFTVYRQEVRPFTEQQIALLQNFAAQAVIAIENARLLCETREALEQQTATAEVLQVINSSPGDLTPVFDAMLEKAVRLCDGSNGILWTFDGERARLAASRNMSSEIVGLLRQQGESGTHPLVQRVIAGDHLFQFDLAEHDAYRSRQIEAAADIVASGVRTIIWVALVKDGSAVGAFVISRQEVRPFTDTQIALLQNFATQAVIAMENARLLTETREALEQQTATTEVLQVINASPGDLQPVFDAMLHRAMRLCAVDHAALELYDGERMHAVAVHGASDRFAETLRNGYPAIDSPASRALLEGGRFAEIADATRVDHVAFQAAAKLDGVRTVLFVPLRRDDAFLGMIASARREVRPFSEKEIALLENFASQAVIAIENARLLNEIRQRQQELRVTFDNMVDGVAMFDTELRLAAWNRNFQQLLALPDEFLTERHDFDTYIRYLTERGEFGEAGPETQIKRLRDRLGDHYSFERTRPDGTVIEVRHNPMPDGGVVLIYSDITERKRSEAEIRAARDAAEAAYRDLKAAQASLVQAEKMASLGQLTAGIAHEIKNPLNFVNNFAGLSVELLDELKETAAPAITALDEDKRAEVDETIEMLTGNLEKIAEHGKRADNIVKSMLEHSRGSSGERRSVDLNGLIEEALNLAYHGARAQDQNFNITLERDFADGISPIELVPQDITRVCLNLFGNGFYAASKRQKERGDPNFNPTLRVTTRDLGEAVEVRIRDNGVGIPADIKDKLFQPFFTTKPTGEGTGLGLSISYDIVTQQHGGAITVDSRVGEFTEFTVRLPRAYGATMPEAAS